MMGRTILDRLGISLGVAMAAWTAATLLPTPLSAETVNQDLLSHTQVIFKDKKAWDWNSEQATDFFAKTTPRGVYLFLHGSGGVNKREVQAAAEAVVPYGYVVVVPDAKSTYKGWYSSKNGSNWRDFIYRRGKETKDYVDYLKTLPWVDQDRLVIHGQSAGALLLADFDWGGFSAAIFTGFNCAAFNKTAIRFPKDIPALSLQDPNDPTFGIERMFNKEGPTYGTCAKEMTKRSSSYVIEYAGSGHKVLYEPKAIEDIRAFLRGRELLE